MNEPELIRAMLNSAKSIAVVGLSDDPAKPSHYVSAYMQQHGYRIYPITPAIPEVLGEKTYATLTNLASDGVTPDIVDVFRLPNLSLLSSMR